MAESIIILDDDEEDTPQPSSSSASSSSAQSLANHISPPLNAQQPVPTHIIKVQRPVPTHIKAQQPVPTRIIKSPIIKSPQPLPTHIITSPFASSKKDSHVLLAENQKLFKEFVEFCSTQTQDCPEVLQFLHVKHSKASPDFLCCAEFRNIVGRCLTRAQANPSKTFVYINELCTVLRQHSAKKRLTITKAESSATSSAFASATSASLKADVKKEDKIVADDEQPSTSGLQEEETNAEETEKERKKRKTSRRQIAYLENLLKVYNDEIRHLQEKELDLDDLAAEDSGYIQEHKLKRKMMKIYEKLCELKSCAPLTGRVIEQRIVCTATRYPEINKKVERFINSPQAHQNPPDYTDILEQVLKANTRHNLCLPRKKLNQIAQDAFRETVGHLQERRHLDLVYNFGSHLTDGFRTASMADPALKDRDLQLKLRANRELALKGLDEVITKYAVKQDDTEDQERAKRLEKGKLRKGKSEKQEDKTKEENGEVAAQENGEVAAQENGEVVAQENGEVAEQEEESEEEEEEDDASSDPDIEEEIQASTQHDGPDDDDDNEAEQASESTNEEAGETEMSASVSAEEGDERKEPVTSGLDAVSQDGNRGMSPLSCEPSPIDCPTQSGSLVEPADTKPSPHSSSAVEEEAADSSNHNAAIVLVSTCSASTDAMSLPPSPVSNGVSSPVTRSGARGRKRKREVRESGNSPYVIHTIIDNGDVDISLDMVVSSSPPPQARSTRADSPSQHLVTSSQSTPPPKKNKVNVSTQCDPDEIIVLSDSE